MESGSFKAEVLLGAVVLAVLGLFVWFTFEVGGGAPKDAKRYVLMLDSGCLWGGTLTAVRLEDRRVYQIPSRLPVTPKPFG